MEVCCPKSVKALALLVTRNDECDRSVDPLTPNSRILTSGFMELTLSPDIEDGEEILSKNGSGEICTHYRDQPRLKGYEVELKLCGVPMALVEMLTGSTLLTDDDGNVVGGVSRESKRTSEPYSKGLELWSLNADKSCSTANNNVYIRWLLPKSTNWEISGDLTFGLAELEVTLKGYAENNPEWVPSFPGADFPSWEDGVPDGVAPPVLPTGIVADDWTLDDQEAIQAGGPLAWKCVGTLPAPLAACDYAPSDEASA